MESRLYRYQVKCDRLQLENDDLEKKLKQQLEDQEQMITFLKRKNHEQAQQFMDLEEKLLALKQAKEKEREKLEAQLTALKEDSQRALDEAAMENKMLQAQLDSLETFRQNKERLENELKQKDEMMEHLKKQHEEIVYNLEKKAVLDKDRCELGGECCWLLNKLTSVQYTDPCTTNPLCSKVLALWDRPHPLV